MQFEWDEQKNLANIRKHGFSFVDTPALTDTFFKRARIRMPKRPLTIQVDSDVLDWFTAQGEDYERRINAALRIYAEAHKAA